jgi:hypothetical protein
MANQDFQMFAGNTKNLLVTLKDTAGVTVDLTGATVKWVAVRGKTVVISKETASGITITDAPNGKYMIKLDSIDTKNLLGNLYHESVVMDSSGNVATVFKGTIKLLPSFI